MVKSGNDEQSKRIQREYTQERRTYQVVDIQGERYDVLQVEEDCLDYGSINQADWDILVRGILNKRYSKGYYRRCNEDRGGWKLGMFR